MRFLAFGLVALAVGVLPGAALSGFEERPLVELDTPAFQKPLKNDGVKFSLKCLFAPCTANATGVVKFPGGKRRELKPLTRQLPADKKRHYKLGLGSDLRRAIKRYFETGKARAAATKLQPGSYDGINRRGSLVVFKVTKAGKISKFRIDYDFKCDSGRGSGDTRFGRKAKINSRGRFTLRTTGAVAKGRVVNTRFAKGTFRRTFNDPGAGHCDTGVIHWSANREGSGEGGKGEQEPLPPIRELDATITVKLTDDSGKVIDRDSFGTILEP